MNINRNTIGGLAVAGILAVAAPAFAASQGGPDRASLDGHADVHAQVGNPGADTPTPPTTVPTPPTTEAPSVSAPQTPEPPSVSAPKRPSMTGVGNRVHNQVQGANGAVPSGSAPSVPSAPSTGTPTPPPSGGGQSSGGTAIQANATAGLSASANG